MKHLAIGALTAALVVLRGATPGKQPYTTWSDYGGVFEDLIILGSATGEGYGDPPGDLRA